MGYNQSLLDYRDDLAALLNPPWHFNSSPDSELTGS